MSPIDDELRAALHGRATAVAPAPDPLAGIERRARRIQRNRIAASVAGSALAVAAIATVVPVLQDSARGPGPDRSQVASTAPTAAPSAAPSPVVTASAYALDPERPWAFRGTPVDEGTRATIQREYATVRRAAEVLVTPLFAQVYEPSGQQEVVFLAEVDGGYRWGVAVGTEAGPEFRWDAPLPDPAYALAAALPGDEGTARLLVVADPEASRTEYGPDDASEFSALAELAPGVAVGPLEGDPDSDVYRVIGLEGQELVRTSAPELDAPSDADAEPAPTQPAEDEGPGTGTALPQNLLSWPARGSASPELLEATLTSFARSVGADRDGVDGRLVYGGSDDTGREFAYVQAWQLGQDAQIAGLIRGGDQEELPFLGPFLDIGPAVLAFLVPAGTGQTTDTLVVVPQPRTGEVLYAADGASEPAPASTTTEGVWLVDRSTQPADDRLLVLDGNGDYDRPVYRGAVAPLLCGAKGCG